MSEPTILLSSLDSSANFVVPTKGGYYESRYVRRRRDYLTCYLSTHSGCRMRCRFCHLTATGQTGFAHATVGEILEQAQRVLGHYGAEVDAGREIPAHEAYFSFMARGEPLASRTILENSRGLFGGLTHLARDHGLVPRFCVSTIMPLTLGDRRLVDVFPTRSQDVVLYYSLYSMDPGFRQLWLPNAMDPHEALRRLADWQQARGCAVKVHGAVIKGENDDERTWANISAACAAAGLEPTFNLVRYNPFDAALGEGGDADLVADWLRDLGHQVHVKERVGFDVKASCGMFVNDSK